MTTTSTLGRALGAALIATTVALAATPASPVAAGEEPPPMASIRIVYNVEDGEPGTGASLTQAEADGLDPELFDTSVPTPADISETGLCTEPDTATNPNPTNDRGYQKVLDCAMVPVTGSAYDFGVANLPNRFYVRNVNCFGGPAFVIDPDGTPSITPTVGETWECFVTIDPKPLVYIDKVVLADDQCVGFAADEVCLLGDDVTDPAQFTLEVYDTDGELVPVDVPIVDTNSATCVPDNEGGIDGGIIIPLPPGVQSSFVTPVEDSACVAVPLAPGNYTMGEILPSHGYEAAFLDCQIAEPFGDEILPPADFGFTVETGISRSTYCTLYNSYVTQTVIADLVLDGDVPSTIVPSEFVIEVIEVSGDQTRTVATGFDPEPGLDNASAEFDLPIGAYRLAVDPPEGYTATVVVTPENVVRRTADAQAPAGPDFTLSRTVRAAGVITVSVAVAATTTTTTTTTTTAAPTTTTPTTAAPTTAASTVATTTPLSSLLPATGNSSDQMSSLLLLAIGLLALGGGAVVATRRR